MAQFTVPNRTLVKKSCVPENMMTTQHLEEVRDYLRRLDQLMEPIDVRMPLKLLTTQYEGGQMRATINENIARRYHIGAGPHLVMTNGASHLHREVLPPRFWAGFRQLAGLNPARAAGVWSDFAALQSRTRVVRTVRMKDDKTKEIYRAIRAVVSAKHNLYANLAMVQDILDNAGHFAMMPVLSWWVSDAGMRIRFVGLDPALTAFAGFDPKALEAEPVPMIDIWNSEVGRAVTGMAGGMYNIRTGTGFSHWDEARSFRWRHVGKQARITARVQTTFTTLTQTAQEVVEAYKDAMDVHLDDPEAWLREKLGGMQGVPDRILQAAIKLLEDPRVTPGGKLATVVDAMTLAANTETDLYTAGDVEQAAARLMFRARSEYEWRTADDGSTYPGIPAPKETK